MRKHLHLALALLLTLSAAAQEIHRPTAQANDATAGNCSGTNQASATMPNFFDGTGESTSSTDGSYSATSAGGWRQRKFTGFAAASGAYSSLTLKIRSSCSYTEDAPTTGTGRCSAQYSTDSGATWTTIFNSFLTTDGVGRAVTTDTVTLTALQDLTKVQVRVCTRGQGNGSDGAETDMVGYDIRTEGVLDTGSAGARRRVIIVP
jgi:hypothetical protein